MTRRCSRLAAIAVIVAIAGTTIDTRPVFAASAAKAPATIQKSDAIEFGARKKRHYRSNNRQALRALGAVAGMIIGLAAAEQRRRERERYYRYDYADPYGPPPYGYYDRPY